MTDIFLREPGGTLSRVTQKSGFGFSAASSSPGISADGNRIALQAAGVDMGSSSAEVAVVHDVTAGTFTALSTSDMDEPALSGRLVTLSADGHYSSFVTADALKASDANGIADVYLRFAYRGSVWPWSLSPGQVQDSSVVPITLRGLDFPVGGPTPSLKVLGAPTITFANVTVVDAATITADMTVPVGVADNSYQVKLEFPGGGPGADAGLTRAKRILTVADPDATADLVNIGTAAGFHAADGNSAGLHTADINDDGFQDVLFITHNPTEEALYLGNGSTVTPMPVMYSADRHDCDSADVNGDGRTDIYCSVGAVKGTGTGDNGLFLQQPNGEYVDAATAWGVTDPYGRGREVAFLHADNDGLPDLFVSNDAPRTDQFLSQNQLFLNVANTSFTPAPGFGVDGELASSCAMSVDFDSDGDDDLVVCGSDYLRMYANQAGAGFTDVSAALGLDEIFIDVDFADVDGDGDLDLAGARPNQFVIYRLEDGAYVETLYTLPADNPRKVSFGDLDADTEPDVFFVQRGCRTGSEGNLQDYAARNDAAVFTALTVPPMTRGCGDSVIAFDHDGDGRDGFLVGNGRGAYGPLQYLVLP
ncbi:MAG: VCBS repeat-containing protein [Halioglobus sp.]|nr:VCBS repeat-containing protein [Halioglobus sp.]